MGSTNGGPDDFSAFWLIHYNCLQDLAVRCIDNDGFTGVVDKIDFSIGGQR